MQRPTRTAGQSPESGHVLEPSQFWKEPDRFEESQQGNHLFKVSKYSVQFYLSKPRKNILSRSKI